MKKLIFIIAILGLAFTSCEKEDLSQYVEVPEEVVDTTNWDDEYGNGGTLPNGGGPVINDLEGTIWVLTKFVTGFATEYPNDTISFVSNNEYTLNGGSVRAYQLSNIPSSTNKDLSLYYFSPFGGSHYSAQVGNYFVDDGELNSIEFEDIQNSSNMIIAWLQKI